MSEKWAVVYEYDLDKGLCFMARRESGAGEIAFFGSQEEAQEWVETGEDIDAEMWDINYIRIYD